MLESVNDRDEFWRLTDLYLSQFDIPTEVADMVCSYLSQIVKPVTEREVRHITLRRSVARHDARAIRVKITVSMKL